MSFNKLYRWTPGQDGAEAGPVRRKHCRLDGCSPKPSNRDRSPDFMELHALNPQQHVT